MRGVITAFTLGLIGLIAWDLKPVQAQSAANAAFYTERVKPIFDANCFRCHGGMNHRAGLNFQTQAGLLKGGEHGLAVIPGDPDNSLLIKVIRQEGPEGHKWPMPLRQAKLSDADIATIAQWIKAGALMPQ